MGESTKELSRISDLCSVFKDYTAVKDDASDLGPWHPLNGIAHGAVLFAIACDNVLSHTPEFWRVVSS